MPAKRTALPPETWRSSRRSHQSRQVDISRARLSRSGPQADVSNPTRQRAFELSFWWGVRNAATTKKRPQPRPWPLKIYTERSLKAHQNARADTGGDIHTKTRLHCLSYIPHTLTLNRYQDCVRGEFFVVALVAYFLECGRQEQGVALGNSLYFITTHNTIKTTVRINLATELVATTYGILRYTPWSRTPDSIRCARDMPGTCAAHRTPLALRSTARCHVPRAC